MNQCDPPFEKSWLRPCGMATFLYSNFCGSVRIEFALLLLALYKSYVSQSDVSIFDPNGRKVELVFVRRRF